MNENTVEKTDAMGREGSRTQFRAAVWFWSVVGFFAAIWVLLPALFHIGYRSDVIELQSIAPQWVWATQKHPMLPAWILEILNLLTHRSFAAPFIAAQLCAILALWSVWQLGRTVLDERLALLGAFALLPYSYFTTQSSLYNQNTVLIAFWCLSMYLVFQAFQTNRQRYWVGAGIALGLTFHAKYPALLLVIAILVYMLMRKEGRKYFRTPGPAITAFVTFLVFLPHLVWLTYHDFAPLFYLSERTSPTTSTATLWWYAPFDFFRHQLLYWIPTLILLTPVIGLAWQWKIQHHEHGKAKECEKFLFYCFIIPLVCLMLYSGIKEVYLRRPYGAPFWVFSGLWLMLRFQTAKETFSCFRWTVTLTIVGKILVIIGFLITFYSGNQIKFVYYPMRELGAECDRIWSSRFEQPCSYISGDWQDAGYAAYSMKDHPRVHFYWDNIGDPNAQPTGTWSTDKNVNQQGGIILWDASKQTIPDWVHQRFPNAEVLPEILELPYKTNAKIPPRQIGIALIPPSSTFVK